MVNIKEDVLAFELHSTALQKYLHKCNQQLILISYHSIKDHMPIARNFGMFLYQFATLKGWNTWKYTL